MVLPGASCRCHLVCHEPDLALAASGIGAGEVIEGFTA
jgi:hypothetical protein